MANVAEDFSPPSKIYRKKNRLSLANYKSGNIYYMTLCCFNRRGYFLEPTTVDECLKQLATLKEKYDFRLWAYCFMPDHLHLLIETSKCLQLVKDFKQKTGFRFKKRTKSPLWQKSYYDHILRKEESVSKVVAYIFNNPVRAGIAENFLDYPYSGAFEFDIKEFMET